jgi:hypothetical protein
MLTDCVKKLRCTKTKNNIEYAEFLLHFTKSIQSCAYLAKQSEKEKQQRSYVS